MSSPGKKRGELSDLVTKYPPHIIALTEILPKIPGYDGATESLLSIRGFELVMPDQVGNARGVALLLRSGVPYKIVKLEGFQDSIVVKLSLPHQGLVTVGLLYRPPRSELYPLTAFTKEFFVGSGPKILVGDFNLPGVDWDLFCGGAP